MRFALFMLWVSSLSAAMTTLHPEDVQRADDSAVFEYNIGLDRDWVTPILSGTIYPVQITAPGLQAVEVVLFTESKSMTAGTFYYRPSDANPGVTFDLPLDDVLPFVLAPDDRTFAARFAIPASEFRDYNRPVVIYTPTPEPGTMMLFSAGGLLIAAGCVRRSKQRRQP